MGLQALNPGSLEASFVMSSQSRLFKVALNGKSQQKKENVRTVDCDSEKVNKKKNRHFTSTAKQHTDVFIVATGHNKVQLSHIATLAT